MEIKKHSDHEFSVIKGNIEVVIEHANSAWLLSVKHRVDGEVKRVVVDNLDYTFGAAGWNRGPLVFWETEIMNREWERELDILHTYASTLEEWKWYAEREQYGHKFIKGNGELGTDFVSKLMSKFKNDFKAEHGLVDLGDLGCFFDLMAELDWELYFCDVDTSGPHFPAGYQIPDGATYDIYLTNHEGEVLIDLKGVSSEDRTSIGGLVYDEAKKRFGDAAPYYQDFHWEDGSRAYWEDEEGEEMEDKPGCETFEWSGSCWVHNRVDLNLIITVNDPAEQKEA